MVKCSAFSSIIAPECIQTASGQILGNASVTLSNCRRFLCDLVTVWAHTATLQLWRPLVIIFFDSTEQVIWNHIHNVFTKAGEDLWNELPVGNKRQEFYCEFYVTIVKVLLPIVTAVSGSVLIYCMYYSDITSNSWQDYNSTVLCSVRHV